MPRKIVDDDVHYGWTRAHRHVRGPAPRECHERVSVWRPEHPTRGLTIRFFDGQGGSTTAGEGWRGHDGGLIFEGVAYNLNRPGIIGALVRAAVARGWDGQAARAFDDGFEVLREAMPSIASQGSR